MRALLAAALGCTALAFAHPAAGQEEPVDQEIVVTGDRDVDRRVREFVGALTPAGSASAQLGRFETPVCPTALGLAPADKAAVEERLRTVAKAAGLEVAPQGCEVNALLMVAEDDKRSFIEELARTQTRYLGNLTKTQVRDLARSPGPAAAWQFTWMVSARGVPVMNDGSGGQLGWFNRTTEPPSRISAPVRPVFQATALVVERRALAGLSTTQLADYAAMRLFARTEPDRVKGSKAPTIVTILDASAEAEVPLSLTAWDLGLLRGLYSAPNNVYAGAQRSEMARQIGRTYMEAQREAE
ncbi:MAG: hypothetical protein ACK40O_02855 [Allosphingosinicella sp.]